MRFCTNFRTIYGVVRGRFSDQFRDLEGVNQLTVAL
jgi:hypothetical protein